MVASIPGKVKTKIIITEMSTYDVRMNDSHAGEEYCFKNENIGGFLECQVNIEQSSHIDMVIKTKFQDESHTH